MILTPSSLDLCIILDSMEFSLMAEKCCTFRITALSDLQARAKLILGVPHFLLSRMVSHELPVKLNPEVMAVQDIKVMVTEMKSL